MQHYTERVRGWRFLVIVFQSGMKPERLIALHDRVALCDWHVVYHPLMHVGYMNPFTLLAIYAIPNLRSPAYVQTNCIAAKILQQNNFGIGKFLDQPFCIGLERDYICTMWFRYISLSRPVYTVKNELL